MTIRFFLTVLFCVCGCLMLLLALMAGKTLSAIAALICIVASLVAVKE